MATTEQLTDFFKLDFNITLVLETTTSCLYVFVLFTDRIFFLNLLQFEFLNITYIKVHTGHKGDKICVCNFPFINKNLNLKDNSTYVSRGSKVS